jgi:hypothetical protein
MSQDFIAALLGNRGTPEPEDEAPTEPLQQPAARAPGEPLNPAPPGDPYISIRVEAAKAFGLNPEAATLIQGESSTAIFHHAAEVARLTGASNRPEATEATLLARAALANAKKVHWLLPEEQAGQYDPDRDRE